MGGADSTCASIGSERGGMFHRPFRVKTNAALKGSERCVLSYIVALVAIKVSHVVSLLPLSFSPSLFTKEAAETVSLLVLPLFV